MNVLAKDHFAEEKNQLERLRALRSDDVSMLISSVGHTLGLLLTLPAIQQQHLRCRAKV